MLGIGLEPENNKTIPDIPKFMSQSNPQSDLAKGSIVKGKIIIVCENV